MKIETEYNIGDTVFFIIDGKIQKGVVQDLNISVNPDIHETYNVKVFCPDCGEHTIEWDSDRLFATPQALVEGLMLNFSNKEDDEQ
jgi:predicted RNA-binding Zn-ribbon protein involved in translation (DUF1610 family)